MSNHEFLDAPGSGLEVLEEKAGVDHGLGTLLGVGMKLEYMDRSDMTITAAYPRLIELVDGLYGEGASNSLSINNLKQLASEDDKSNAIGELPIIITHPLLVDRVNDRFGEGASETMSFADFYKELNDQMTPPEEVKEARTPY